MKGDDSKELLNEWASFVPSTKEDWLSNCIHLNKKFSSPLKICFQQYLLVWGNFKATPMLVLVHYSRSHPITTSSHSMATLLLVYFTLTQTFPLSPLQTPHSHPLWWIFLLLPWLKTGFSLKTSFFWSCSRLTHPVLQIRKLCVLLILVSYTVGKNPFSYEAHTTWLCYAYPPLLSVYEPFITWAQSSSLLRTSCHLSAMPSSSQITHATNTDLVFLISSYVLKGF